MATRPRILILTALAALTGVAGLAGCSGASQQTEPTTDDTPGTTSAAEPTPDGTPTETPPVEPTEEADDALPPGFPDPATLIGQVVHDEQAADGSWHTVVAGAPLALETILGACFDGGSGDLCGYSVSAAVAPSAGEPEPQTAALALLLRDNGPLADDTPTWVVLDAVVTTSPGGEPAYVELCDNGGGVLIWAEPGATGDTIPALAAWGPDATVSSLVEVDPASLSCPWMGD